MPKLTVVESGIPALYRRTALNLSMFAYVRGVRATLHTVTVAEAVGMFMDDYVLDHDNFNRSSALSTYNRMQSELRDLKRSEDAR